jgi:FSR family fosmidomycin resistance protein-like MFS transporter
MSTATIAATQPTPLRQDASIIGLVGLAHAGSHFSHLLLPLMFPVFMTEFALSYAQAGLLMTLFFVVSGLGQAAAGFLVDRWGARPVLFASQATFVIACLAAAAAPNYEALLLVAALAGLANSPFHPVDFTIMNQRVSASRLGYAYSMHGLSGNLGWALAPVFMAGLSSLYHWRAAYLGAAVLYAAILLLLLVNRRSLATEVVAPNRAVGAEHDLAFMRLPVVWWCFAFFLLSTMTFAMIQSFAVSLLKAMHAVPFEAATLTLTAYSLCGAVGMLAGGLVATRAAASDRVVATCMTVAAVLLALCATGWPGGMGTMVLIAATGFAIGIGGPSRDMMIKRATPKGATGRVYGLVYSGLDVGFAIAPVLFGVLMDRGMYAATYVGAALILLLSVVAALGVGNRSSA